MALSSPAVVPPVRVNHVNWLSTLRLAVMWGGYLLVIGRRKLRVRRIELERLRGGTCVRMIERDLLLG